MGYKCFFVRDKNLIPVEKLENTNTENNYYFLPTNLNQL